MATKTWTSHSFQDLANGYAWSDGTAPAAGDLLVMRQGAAYLWNQDLSSTPIYMGAEQGGAPVFLWMQNSAVNINLGVTQLDASTAAYQDRSVTIDAYGSDRIQMVDSGYRPGGNGNLTIHTNAGSQVSLAGSVGWMSTLSVTGNGAITNENLDSTYADSVVIKPDMLGHGTMSFHGFTVTEIGGAVGDGQIFTLDGSRNNLTVDNARAFNGALNLADSGAQGDSIRMMFPGADVTHADFSMGQFHIGASDGTSHSFKGSVPAAGVDIWHVAGGVVIGAKPQDATSNTPMWHAIPTTA